MKMTITKIIGSFMLSAGLAFALTSCQKDLNTGFENHLTEQQSAAGTDRSQPIGCESEIPAILNVPEGNKLAYRTYATGVQIYEVRRSASNPNVFVWVNTAPAADLYIQPNYNNLVGIHYGGPSWEFIQGPYKGEKTVAARLQGVTVDPAAIPWLLLKVNAGLSSPGNQVTYIQRVCTTGGLAPAIIPNESNLGQVEEVPYTATYLFYEKANEGKKQP
ncbi:MAG: DUF3455 domain-containing protein [Thermoanaerobaculia bacterium]|nr:DUF3455 domain-containing protein [Thermoanaerobaculia bacterium]